MPQLLFSLTPPRASHSPERVAQLAKVTLERVSGLPLDGLVLYDLDEEAGRTSTERPFPFSPTMDPAQFYLDHLRECPIPVYVYRAVGKYSPDELTQWLLDPATSDIGSVFVGAATPHTPMKTSLMQAYQLRREHRPSLPLGAVAIPERHSTTETEHEAMLRKQGEGVSFFVTQVVYDVDAAKNMASDYFYACQDRGIIPQRIVFSFSVCGSGKTLEFLEWLGVHVPRWMRNTLTHCTDPLTESYVHCVNGMTELAAFCHRLGQPCGFNVESVSIRRVEIEATVDLARHMGRVFSAPSGPPSGPE